MGRYLEIENLRLSFKTFEGTRNVLDLEYIGIDKGETFGLVGESGTGKSVLALSLLKLLPMPPGIVESGRITFEGQNLLDKSEGEMRKLRGSKMTMIFQDPMSTLNPVFTVGEQIVRVIRQNRGGSRPAAEKQALEMIKLVNLPDPQNLMQKYPHELSGGQRQRVIIAIALSCGAEFLIADEPTRNLDVTIQAGVLKLLAELKRELKVTMLFIANNLGLVSAICDRMAVVHEGRVVETGTVREVINHPRHPYTLILLRAIPRNRDKKIDLEKLAAGGGSPAEAKGCNYYHRCFERRWECRDQKPVLKSVGGSHYVACFAAEEGGKRSGRAAVEG